MLEVVHLGRLPYKTALELQRRSVRDRQHGHTTDQLFLVEHDPVITLGRRAMGAHVLADADTLAARGIEVERIERGGDVTFHGPGQLVGYPIIYLRERKISGPRQYISMLEETLIRALADYRVQAFRQPGEVGVWTSRGKIAALGVAISHGVTMHGFALNVNTNLDYFQLIVPCGRQGAHVTTLNQCLGKTIELPEVERRVTAAFVHVFGYEATREDRPSPPLGASH